MPEGLGASTFQMSMVFEDNLPCTRKLLDGAVTLGFMVYLVNLLWAEQTVWTCLTHQLPMGNGGYIQKYLAG